MTKLKAYIAANNRLTIAKRDPKRKAELSALESAKDAAHEAYLKEAKAKDVKRTGPSELPVSPKPTEKKPAT